MRDNIYQDNKPLVYSLLTGLLYFLFCWSIEFSEYTKVAFMTLMLFLPGVTFPFATCYFNSKNKDENASNIFLHFILSVGIYHGSVWLFSAEGRIKYITILAGFCGSLFFLLVTKFLLKKTIIVWQIFVASILSGLGFLPFAVISGTALYLGLAVLTWTIVNGFLLNIHYKSHMQATSALQYGG